MTQIQQRGQGLLDGRVGVAGEDDAPAGLVELLGIDTRLDAEVLGLIRAKLQLAQIGGLGVAQLGYLADLLGERFGAHGRYGRCAFVYVDAVEIDRVDIHGFS